MLDLRTKLALYASAGLALLVAGVLVTVGIRSEAIDRACDASCIALGHATQHARLQRDSARTVATAAETVYVAGRAAAREAVTAVAKAQTPRDSITALVVAVQQQGDVLTNADTMLAAFQREREASDRLLYATELERDTYKARLAVKPPRVALYVSGLYDPLAGVPAASLDGEVRITERLSVVGRVEQRVMVGEKPRVYVGGRVKV